MLPAEPWKYIQKQPLFITSTADLISCSGISISHLTGLPVSELAHLQASLKKAAGEIQLKYKLDQITALPSTFGGFPCHFWVKAKFITTQPYNAWHNPDPSAFWTVSHPGWLHSSPRGPAAPHTPWVAASRPEYMSSSFPSFGLSPEYLSLFQQAFPDHPI